MTPDCPKLKPHAHHKHVPAQSCAIPAPRQIVVVADDLSELVAPQVLVKYQVIETAPIIIPCTHLTASTQSAWWGGSGGGGAARAPEIDPACALTALMPLVLALIVLRAR